MNITKLWAKVTIQRKSASVDAIGQPVNTWSDVGDTYADVRHMKGLEALRADAVANIVRASFRIRSNSVTRTITAADRLVFQNIPYNVTSVLPQGRNEMIDITAERSTNTPLGD